MGTEEGQHQQQVGDKEDLPQAEEQHQQQTEQQQQQVEQWQQQAVQQQEQAEQQQAEEQQEQAEQRRQQQAEQQQADDTSSSGGDAECIICFTAYDGVFKLPKLLRCGHTFCLECLARINVCSEAVTSLNCPICRDITRLPARRGPPALNNNQEILEQLPQELRPTRSVRFSRKKGLLYVKTKPSSQSTLPKPLQVSTVSLSLDVGRPPPRVRVPPSFARGSWLFYATVAIAVLLTVAVVMVGVYIFFIVPNGNSGPSNSSSTSGSMNGHNRTLPQFSTPH